MTAQYVLCVLAALGPAAGPPHDPWLIEVGLGADQLRTRTAQLRDEGYQPISVYGYNDRENIRYAVAWEKSRGPAWVLDYGLSGPQLDRRSSELKAKGYRPIGLSGYDLIGSPRYIDLWRKTDGAAWQVEYGLDADQLRRSSGLMKEKGYRPRSLSSCLSATFTRYAVVWEKGGDVAWDLRWGLSSTGLQDALNSLGNEGYRPVALAGLGIEERQTFACAWEKRKGAAAWQARYGLTADALNALARSMRTTGYRPSYLSGYDTLDGVRYASIWEKK